MSGLPAYADSDALRPLRAARELALRRLAVHEKATRRRQSVGGARPIRSLLFTDHEEKIHALLARLGESLSRGEHGGGDSLGVRRAATGETIALQTRRHIGRHGIEVGGERHASATARSPDVGSAAGYFLKIDVPSARDEPPRDEVDGGALRTRGGVDREELRGQRHDVSHRAQSSRGENPLPTDLASALARARTWRSACAVSGLAHAASSAAGRLLRRGALALAAAVDSASRRRGSLAGGTTRLLTASPRSLT